MTDQGVIAICNCVFWSVCFYSFFKSVGGGWEK